MLTVLSLDDCPDMIELQYFILTRAGYNHIGVTTNEAALGVLRCQPVDLLIQDLMRSGMDGWTFYDYMQQDPVLREIPVLVVTACTPSRAEPAYYQMDGYLIKPYGPQELEDEVRRILQLYQERDDAGRRIRREVILHRRAQERERMERALRSSNLSKQFADLRAQYLFDAVKLVAGNRRAHAESSDTASVARLDTRSS